MHYKEAQNAIKLFKKFGEWDYIKTMALREFVKMKAIFNYDYITQNDDYIIYNGS